MGLQHNTQENYRPATLLSNVWEKGNASNRVGTQNIEDILPIGFKYYRSPKRKSTLDEPTLWTQEGGIVPHRSDTIAKKGVV